MNCAVCHQALPRSRRARRPKQFLIPLEERFWLQFRQSFSVHAGLCWQKNARRLESVKRQWGMELVRMAKGTFIDRFVGDEDSPIVEVTT